MKLLSGLGLAVVLTVAVPISIRASQDWNCDYHARGLAAEIGREVHDAVRESLRTSADAVRHARREALQESLRMRRDAFREAARSHREALRNAWREHREAWRSRHNHRWHG